jgi:Family of unknown function (DUF5681)
MTERPPHPTKWKPGQSGNPAGRPRGARSLALQALDQIGEAGASEILVKAVFGGIGMTIARRIAALEKTTRAAGMLVIRISGGFQDGVDGDHGTAGGGASIYREPDETALDFLDRLVATAKADRKSFVTISGFTSNSV